MSRTVIPGYRPALVLGCQQAWGPETNLPGFPSQPLSWGFQASRPPGLPSRTPFTLRTSSGSFWELTCSSPRHLLQANSPCPTTSQGPDTKTLQEANSSELPTLPSPSPPTSRPSSPSTSLCVNKSERFYFWIPVAPAPSSPNPFEFKNKQDN